MTQSIYDTKLKIVMQLFIKGALDAKSYFAIKSSLDLDKSLPDEFLIDLIVKKDIEYKNFPLKYKAKPDFLRKVIAVRPKTLGEIEKSEPRVYFSLMNNMPLTDIEKVRNMAKQNGSRLVKINVFSSKQVG